MKSLNQFICRPHDGRRYNHSKNIGGKDFTVNIDSDDHKYSNRFAEIVELPHIYKGQLSPGDLLLVHHNVFRFYTGSKGRNMSGKSFLDGDLFLIDELQMYGYKKKGSDSWVTFPQYSLVEPIQADPGLSVKIQGYTPLYGKVKVSGKMSIDDGVLPGQKVIFTPESEYEFEIDGDTLYRIKHEDLAIAL